MGNERASVNRYSYVSCSTQSVLHLAGSPHQIGPGVWASPDLVSPCRPCQCITDGVRYGSPGKVLKQYEEFAKWYLKAFTPGTLKVVIAILDGYRSGQYVAPRVLQQAINYLNKW